MKHELRKKYKNGRNGIKTSLNMQSLTNVSTFSKNKNREILPTSTDSEKPFLKPK
jgi:hypothetical protein